MAIVNLSEFTFPCVQFQEVIIVVVAWSWLWRFDVDLLSNHIFNPSNQVEMGNKKNMDS